MTLIASETSHPMIPQINIAPILNGNLESDRAREVRAQICTACSEIGFVAVTGHGISLKLIEAMALGARLFFSLTKDVKWAVAPRRWNSDNPNEYRGYFPSSTAGKEGFDIGEPTPISEALEGCPYHERNHFPETLGSEWADLVAQYFGAMSSLSDSLLRVLVAELGGEPKQVSLAFARPESLSTLRLNFYPNSEELVTTAKDDGAKLCCEEHVDSGFLTLLHQDDRAGLQIRGTDGQWHNIPPNPESFVVNIGLALQELTGGTLVATEHRVLQSKGTRLSIPFFFEPIPDFEMAPQSLGLSFDAVRPSRHYEDFLRDSLMKFAEYDR